MSSWLLFRSSPRHVVDSEDHSCLMICVMVISLLAAAGRFLVFILGDGAEGADVEAHNLENMLTVLNFRNQDVCAGDQDVCAGDRDVGEWDQDVGAGDRDVGARDQDVCAGDHTGGAGDQGVGEGDQDVGEGDQDVDEGITISRCV
jgi:hypothetical protein